MTFISSKSIVMIIFMYTTSFLLLAAQFVLADTMHFTLFSPVTGQPLKSNLIQYIQLNNLNTIQGNVSSTTRATVISSATSYLGITWEIISLMLGGYIFNIFTILGVPGIFVAGFQVAYYILLIITFIALIRATFF